MKGNTIATIRITASKEMKDFFRDPRSLILSLLLPLLLFPLLFWVLHEDSESPRNKAESYHIAVENNFPEEAFIMDPESYTTHRLEHNSPDDWRQDFDLLFTLDSETGLPVIVFDNTDSDSAAAALFLQQLNTQPLAAPSSPAAEPPVNAGILQPLYPRDEAAGTMMLALILPFIFFTFAVTCSLPGAADLSSGEKERGSLEPLLSTAASRTGIIAGKLTASSLIAVCSVAAYMMGIWISILFNPGILGEEAMAFNLSLPQIALLCALLLLLTILFSSIELCAGFIARSVREAQLLGMPLLMIGIGAVYTAQNMDVHDASWFYAHIPLVNIARAVRLTALDRITALDSGTTFAWCVIYILLIAMLAVNMFQKEVTLIKK